MKFQKFMLMNEAGDEGGAGGGAGGEGAKPDVKADTKADEGGADDVAAIKAQLEKERQEKALLAENNRKLLEEKKKKEKEAAEAASKGGNHEQLLKITQDEVEKLRGELTNYTEQEKARKERIINEAKELELKKLFSEYEFHDWDEAKKAMNVSKLVLEEKDGKTVFNEAGKAQLKEEFLAKKSFHIKTNNSDPKRDAPKKGGAKGEVTFREGLKEILSGKK